MRNLIWLILIVLLANCQRSGRLDVVTFHMGTDMDYPDINHLENRLPLIQEFFHNRNPEIIAMQAVDTDRLSMLIYILPNYEHVIPESIDTISKIDFIPIFYDQQRISLLAKSHFLVSEIPDIELNMSSPQMVNWAKMQNNSSGHIFFVFNTHIYSLDDDSQSKSAALLLKKIKDIAGFAPVLLTGSFNMSPEDRSYRIVQSNWDRFISLENSLNVISQPGQIKTHSFNKYGKPDNNRTTDHIFINSYFDVKKHNIHEVIKEETYISDHFPVSARVIFLFDRRSKEGAITDEPWRYQQINSIR